MVRFMPLLRSNKNGEQEECDTGRKGRPGARQPPPHAEGLQYSGPDGEGNWRMRDPMARGVSSVGRIRVGEAEAAGRRMESKRAIERQH